VKTTKDIVSCLAEEAEISVGEAHSLTLKVFDIIADYLAAGERVSIVRFGIFRLKHISAHVVRMPFLARTALVTERKHPMFVCSQRLKERVNAGKGLGPPQAAKG